MRAGELRHRITIQQNDESGAAWNGTDSYTTFATVWAKIEPVSGETSLDRQTAKEQSEVTHIFTIRYLSGMNTGKRIYFDSRYFTPLSVHNIDERDYKMEIEAREDTDA